MNWIKENWFKVAILLIALLIVSGAFYWYELRLIELSKKCYEGTYARALKFPTARPNDPPEWKNAEEEQRKDLGNKYDVCIKTNGESLKEELEFGF